MFSEILKIKPQLDNGDLNKMERTLSQRFGRIAKRFGSGLLSAIKGGGIAGLALGLIDKVLNPLQAVQEAIEKSMHAGDDLSTFAKQFNTTEGNLSRLQAFGKASGLDPEGVRLLLGKFQGAVAQAAANPGEQTAVSAFVGRKDTAESFFEFLQSMQKLTDVQKNLVQQEVFGERQILKASEFLNSDFGKIDEKFKQIGVPSAADQTKAAKFLGGMSDTSDIFAAARIQTDLVSKGALLSSRDKKGNILGAKYLRGVEAREQLDLSQENKGIAKVPSLEKISLENQKLMNMAVDAFLKIAPLLAQALPMIVQTLSGTAKAVENSRVLRGIVPGKDK